VALAKIASVGLTGFSLITNPGNAGAAGPDGDLLKSIRSGNDKPVKNEQVKERGALPTWADVFRRNQLYY